MERDDVSIDGMELRLTDPDARPVDVARWARATVPGALLAAAMIGLREALEDLPRPEIVLEIDHSAGDEDDPFLLDFSSGDPAAASVTVRPWLLGR